MSQRLELVNRINDNYKVVRSSVTDNGRLWYDYYLSYSGGISKFQVVHTYKKFLAFSVSATSKGDEENIVK
jgi:hypothetical protein